MGGAWIALVATVVVLAALGGLYALVAYRSPRERRIRGLIFGHFVAAAARGGGVRTIAVEADWIAAILLGIEHLQLDAWTQLPRGLDAEQTARWIETLAEVRWVGGRLIAEGYLEPYKVQFANAKPGQRINPPAGLWMLAPRGAALVLRRQLKEG